MGEFEKYTVEDLVEILRADRPEAMHGQADAWSDLAALLSVYRQALRDHIDRSRGSWSGNASEAYFSVLTDKHAELGLASDIADRNATGWRSTADAVAAGQRELRRINDEWQRQKEQLPADPQDPKEGADWQRQPFDESARATMTSTATDMDLGRAGMSDPLPIAPLPAVSLPEDGSGNDGGITVPPGVSDGRYSGGSGPDLQSAGQGAVPSTGASPSAGGPAPVASPNGGPAPVAPPPGRAVPPVGGGVPRSPGGTPPIGSRPPATGGRPGPVPRPGGTPRGLTPRPGTGTVRPVIGSRPGSSGMAPTRPTRTPSPVNRPVIGSRSGTSNSTGGPETRSRSASTGRTATGRTTANGPGRTSAGRNADDGTGRGATRSGTSGRGSRSGGGTARPGRIIGRDGVGGNPRATGGRTPGVTGNRGGPGDRGTAGGRGTVGGRAPVRAVRTPRPVDTSVSKGVIRAGTPRPPANPTRFGTPSRPRDHRDEDRRPGAPSDAPLDAFWTPPPTVPPVITGRVAEQPDPSSPDEPRRLRWTHVR